MPEDTRDIAVSNRARLDGLEQRIDKIDKNTEHIREVVDQAKGGWRMLLLVGSASAAIGAVVVKIIEWVRH